MAERSPELEQELIKELGEDIHRMLETLTRGNPSTYHVPGRPQLEMLVYITEQIRLKLKLLGAPRIYD